MRSWRSGRLSLLIGEERRRSQCGVLVTDEEMVLSLAALWCMPATAGTGDSYSPVPSGCCADSLLSEAL